ncbi:MAG: response regulator [Candidatus Latescibacterota bacterium]
MAVILVVDDSKEIRLMLDDFLKLEGHTVFLAENGECGQRIFLSQGQEIDLLISDIYMPEMDGLEFIRMVLAKRPDMKVIAMSAGDTKGNLASLGFAGDFGAQELLSKPFRMPDLLAAVNRLLV